jgi:hypothetical protein
MAAALSKLPQLVVLRLIQRVCDWLLGLAPMLSNFVAWSLFVAFLNPAVIPSSFRDHSINALTTTNLSSTTDRTLLYHPA